MIFHEEAQGLTLIDESDKKKHWFISEEKIENIAHGRGLATWKLWREDGLHVASCFQDGMLRMTLDGKPGGAAAAFGAIRATEEVERKKKGDSKL